MRKSEKKSHQANEAISKFKLLSAYGGPGSIIHTEYGSIIISCIEEWGFIHELSELYKRGILLDEDADTIRKRAEFEEITISNDERLLQELRRRKGLPNLALLALIPSIELNEVFNTVKDNKTAFAINSEFMPKGFYDDGNRYKTYREWYTLWSGSKQDFFPPKYTILSDKGNRTFDIELNQENIVLICKNGHISDFPWSKFLRWRLDNPHDIDKVVDLFGFQTCCAKPDIQINETTANASGFDGKWLKCNNPGCTYKSGTSLKGLMSLRVVCPGHKPWESITGQNKSYNGAKEVRNSSPRAEACGRQDLKVALTTGNNIYFARSLTSIYMPPKLFLDANTIKIKELEAQLEIAKDNGDWPLCMSIDEQIKAIGSGMEGVAPLEQLTDREREIKFRFQEFTALVSKSIEEINIDRDNLTAYDVTENLDPRFACFFNRLLRIDRLKVTSAQLDFTRVEPYETGSSQVQNRNIFRSSPEQVLIYPVVENYGEGIFFSFNQELIRTCYQVNDRLPRLLRLQRNNFATGALRTAEYGGNSLYMVHTFCHLIMRELEFRCGYPTASLSERLYISNNLDSEMYGCLIYTAEGSEGSMGGLIAQTRKKSLNDLIRSALLRSSICNSDPLCWQSEGQGLFELNLAACFSCGLISETSCECRNIYLDRRALVDKEFGFFKDIIPNL